MFRKFLSVLLVFSLCFSFTACSKNESSSKKKSNTVSDNKNKEDNTEVEYNRTFTEKIEKPKYKLSDIVKFKKNIKKKELSLSYKPLTVLDKATFNKLFENEVVEKFSTYSDLYEKYSSDLDVVYVEAIDDDKYREAYINDEDIDNDEYTEYCYIYLPNLDDTLRKSFIKSSSGENVIERYNDKTMRFFVHGFCKLNRFKVKDLTDKLVIEKTDYTSIKEYKNDFYRSCFRSIFKKETSDILSFLRNNCTINIPEDLLKYYVLTNMYYLDFSISKTSLGKYKDVVDYFDKERNKSFEEFLSDYREEFKEYLECILMCEYLVKKYNISKNYFSKSDLAFYKEILDSLVVNNITIYDLSMKNEFIDITFNKIFLTVFWCVDNLNIKVKSK